MAGWIKDLRLLSEAEFHARRILATLATVAADGSPRARVVIVRGIFEDGSVITTTSAASDKVAEIEQNSAVEMLFWFPHERQQFRLRGPARLIREGDMLLSQWEDLNDGARALFYWPPPGLPLHAGQQFPHVVGSEVPPPDSFVILKLNPTFVETLDLNEHPHCRRRYHATGNTWTVEEITP